MAKITIEVKDEHLVEICKAMGYSYDPEAVPSLEEHSTWLGLRLQGFIPYDVVVTKDPEVIAKEAELVALRAQKIEYAKTPDTKP